MFGSQRTGMGSDTMPSKEPSLLASWQAIISHWPVLSWMSRPL